MNDEINFIEKAKNDLDCFYNKNSQKLEFAKNDLRSKLYVVLGNLGLNGCGAVTSLEERESSLEKISRKCLCKNSSYLRRLREGEDIVNIITDILRARITCNYSDHIDIIANSIRNQFEVVDEDSVDHRIPSKFNQFGYAALHLICAPSAEMVKLWGVNIVFEIQIRTRLMDFWGLVNWDVGHKPEKDPPFEIKRRMSEISALFHLIDRQFIEVRDFTKHHKNLLYDTSDNSFPLSNMTKESLNNRRINLNAEELSYINNIMEKIKIKKSNLSDVNIDNMCLYIFDNDKFSWIASNYEKQECKNLQLL